VLTGLHTSDPRPKTEREEPTPRGSLPTARGIVGLCVSGAGGLTTPPPASCVPASPSTPTCGGMDSEPGPRRLASPAWCLT
jgi:hypothetical protein